jgi:hypothetical protein
MVPPGRLIGCSAGGVVRLVLAGGEGVVGMNVGRASRGAVSDADVGAASRSRVSTSIFCSSLLFFFEFWVGTKDIREGGTAGRE